MERIRERVTHIKIGDTADYETTMVPLVSKTQLARVLGYIETGRKEGARSGPGQGAGFPHCQPGYPRKAPSPLGRKLEVHLLDYDGELYGLTLEVVLAAFMREEKRSPDIEAPKEQMRRDCWQTRRILSRERIPDGVPR